MKPLLAALSLVLPFVPSVLPAGDAAPPMKIGIVDMTRVFAEFHKTKEAENQMNDGKATSKKELDERGVRYKELVEKYSELAAAIKDPGLSEELRAAKQKEAQAIAAEARSLEREKEQFAVRRQRQLLEPADRMRGALVEEILEHVSAMAREGNYDLVFDKSGLGTRGIPFLLHSRDAVDFSNEVITTLNRKAPAP